MPERLVRLPTRDQQTKHQCEWSFFPLLWVVPLFWTSDLHSFRCILPGVVNRFQLPDSPAFTLANSRTFAFHRISAFPYAILMRFALPRFTLWVFP
jgi:hypothetical protein